jgi:DNA gyrase/topoisomerase IV subunit B
MKIRIEPINATPSKRLYLSIIADYDVNKAICELVDNALDIWVLAGRAKGLTVDIVLDEIQQRIHASDNAGGVKKSDLHLIVAPGYTGNPEHQEIIGMFGVGTKRAVVALAQEVKIRTRHSGDTFQVEFNDDWIKESDDWLLPVDQVDNIPRGTTQIELTKSNVACDEKQLRDCGMPTTNS